MDYYDDDDHDYGDYDDVVVAYAVVFDDVDDKERTINWQVSGGSQRAPTFWQLQMEDFEIWREILRKLRPLLCKCQ